MINIKFYMKIARRAHTTQYPLEMEKISSLNVLSKEARLKVEEERKRNEKAREGYGASYEGVTVGYDVDGTATEYFPEEFKK